MDDEKAVGEEVKNLDINQYQEPGPREKHDSPTDVKGSDYYKDLVRQKEALDPQQFPEVVKLIERELKALSTSSKFIGTSNHVHTSVNLINYSRIRLTVKCFLPTTKEFQQYNHAHQILGPKGTYFKALISETGAEMYLRGKGCLKDTEMEQSLRDGGDWKYAHLKEKLHVVIKVVAPAAPDAYTKLAYAIKCLKEQVLMKDFGPIPHWIESVIRTGKPPTGYYESHSSNDRYPGYTRDPTRPLRAEHNNENYEAPAHSNYGCSDVNWNGKASRAFLIAPIMNTASTGNWVQQVLGSARDDPFSSNPSRGYSSAAVARFHPYRN